MAKPTSLLQSCRSRTEFFHPRSRSGAVALGEKKIIPLEKCTTYCIGSDSYGAGTRVSKFGTYVSGSFVAGTSALSPGVPLHMHLFKKQKNLA